MSPAAHEALYRLAKNADNKAKITFLMRLAPDFFDLVEEEEEEEEEEEPGGG